MTTLTPQQERDQRLHRRVHDKARYEQAREAARAKYSRFPRVTVPENANVLLCEGGAYVESMVWVGDDEL